jgi:hypothetical protein
MTSSSPRPTRVFGAITFAAILAASLAVAINAFRRIARTARREASREAELDDWARADPPPPAL